MATILVADDEEMVRGLASLVLRSAGHQVITAANGVEAVALFRSSPDKFDVIVTDLRMPVMDGRQVVRLVRETKPGARIVCMSGYAEQGIPNDVEFLCKPFLPGALRESVDKLLRRG